jgi:uncharacterized protein (TIGR02284 family)
MTNEEQIGHVHELIAVAKDGELGYATAAHHVNDARLATVFSEYAREHARFAKDLEDQSIRLGGERPDETGTFTGYVFRGWIGLKSAIMGGAPAAIVAACETGEDSAATAFERVVNMDITGQTRALIEAQWSKIKEAHRRMIHLRAQFSGQPATR